MFDCDCQLPGCHGERGGRHGGRHEGRGGHVSSRKVRHLCGAGSRRGGVENRASVGTRVWAESRDEWESRPVWVENRVSHRSLVRLRI